MRAWYLPMCVRSARPFTSPIAYSQSCPGPHRVVHLDRLAGLEADRVEPDVVAVQLAADRHQQLVGAHRPAARRARPSPRRPPPAPTSRSCRACTSTPFSRSDCSTSSHANGSSRAIRRSPRSISVTVRAERAVRLRHLHAHHAAAEDRQPPRHLLRGGGLAVGPGLGLAQAVDRRDQRRAAGGHHHRLARDERVVARPPRGARRRGGRARAPPSRSAARATAPGWSRRGRG